MTIRELRKMFWREIATKEMCLEYSPKKSQNDYSTNVRCYWCDFVESARRCGMITDKQAECYATLG